MPSTPLEFDVHKTTERLTTLMTRYLPSADAPEPAHEPLYNGSALWEDHTIWTGFQHTEPRPAGAFVREECRNLVAKLLSLTKAVSGKHNPSHLLRFVASIAGRHLDILAQLESLKREVFEASLVHVIGEPKPSTRPQKDHVLHAACVLDAAVALLDMPAYDGRKLFQHLFEAMENAYNHTFHNSPSIETFDNSPASEKNPLAAITSDEDRRAFVVDCCVGAVLAHDNGYLPMFELHLRDARVGHLMGFLKPDESQSARDQLRTWLEQVEKDVTAHLSQLGANGTALPFLIPPYRNAWMAEGELKEKPDKLHGAVSGYQLLDYFFRSKSQAWKCLAPVEQWMLLMIAGASIFHGAELPALCDPALKPEDIVDAAQLKAALTNPDNPVRLALESEPDPKALLEHANRVDTDRGARAQILRRLNKWIFEEALHHRTEFAEALYNSAGKKLSSLPLELRELLPDKKKEKNRGEHAKAWRVRLNRLILEATLCGCLRSSLDDALALAWQYNPLGLYLYSVDAMQEWVRLAWETTHSLGAGPNGKTFPPTNSTRGPGCLLTDSLVSGTIEGLTVMIGQAPIPTTAIEFILRADTTDQTERIVIRYPELEPKDRLFVTQYGYYDRMQLTGEFQKARTIPAAMRLITGCEAVDCIIPDISEKALNDLVEKLEKEICDAAEKKEWPELQVPSRDDRRKERCAVIRRFLRDVDIHRKDRFVNSACEEIRNQARLHQHTTSKKFPTLIRPEDLDKCLEECLKAAYDKMSLGGN